MRIKNIDEMSVSELKKAFKQERDGHNRRKILGFISYLESENEKAIEKYQQSDVLKAAAMVLRKEGKAKPVYDGECLIGYEYCWGEAILKLYEAVSEIENKELKNKGVSRDCRNGKFQKLAKC